MPSCVLRGGFALLLGVVAFAFTTEAQTTNTGQAEVAAPSIQQQIDTLREGQQRILRELEEIKKLLEERPVRNEVAARPAMPEVITLNVTGEPFRGESKAKVVILEYSDFECSYCGKYVRDTFPRIDAEYIKTGRIKYLFRDLPAPEHKNALAAAQAARCAGEQGKFWEMHDLLFASQVALAPADIQAFAQILGLDLDRFNECLASNKYAEAIRRSAAGAERSGVYGTPAFLIGTMSDDGNIIRATKVLVGGESFEVMKAALDEVLESSPK
jgi:protein-disulfide isomerase